VPHHRPPAPTLPPPLPLTLPSSYLQLGQALRAYLRAALAPSGGDSLYLCQSIQCTASCPMQVPTHPGWVQMAETASPLATRSAHTEACSPEPQQCWPCGPLISLPCSWDS
jgi:hypothetical protein